MSKNVAITIIIPTHNRRELLEETVVSVLAQSFTDWELYIIDDCSTDDTWEWLASNTQRNVFPLRMEINVERSRARNIGLSKAQGEFVLFLDDDDLLTTNALSSLIRAYDKFPEAIASIGCFMTFDENKNEKYYQAIKKLCCTNIFKDYLFGSVATAGHTLFKTDAFRRIGGWNEKSSFAEDHEMWFKIALDENVILIPDITLKYRVHGQWRPDNQDEVLYKIRDDAVNKLPEDKRNWGEGILRARKLLPIAEQLYANDQMFNAFFVYIRIAINAPSLLVSPISKQVTLIPMLKCLLTSYGVKAGKKMVSFIKTNK